MCTGLEIALMAAGAAGNVMSANAAQRQADEIALAENRQLTEFLTRNDQRSRDARQVFEQRKARAEPEAVAQTQQGAADTRRGAMFDAIAAAPSAAAPMRASAGRVIGDEAAAAGAREAGEARSRADARSRIDSFGDTVFRMGVDTTDAGRQIDMINAVGGVDARLLGPMQNLAGAEAALRNRPSMIGQVLSGGATAGGFYAGSRAGGR